MTIAAHTDGGDAQPAGPAIGLVGTFDVSNFGDCLFTNVHAHLLRQRFPHARISLYSPWPVTAAIMDNGPVRALPDQPDACAFAEDMLILAGGETVSVGHGSGVHIFPEARFSAFLRLWLVAAVAQMMRETGWPVLLLPICHHLHDDMVLDLLAERLAAAHPDLAPRVHCERRLLKVLDTAALIAGSGGFVGTSLHGAVASVAFARPMAILSKHLDGKHAQTLLAAGVDGLVTDRFDALPGVLAMARTRDLVAARTTAMARARADHAQLCDALAAPRPARPPLDRQALAAIMAADRAAVANPKERLKRLLFTALRQMPPLWTAFDRFKLRRRLRARA